MALPQPDSSTTVLITGASSGVGEEFARQLASRGHGVTITARRRDRLEALADGLRGEHSVDVIVHECDLGDEDARKALIAGVEADGKDLIGLVNNAGFGSSGRFWELDLDWEAEEVRVNAVAVHHLTGAFLPEMVGRGAGAVLNVASVAAFQPLPGMATYAATKAFVVALSEAVHEELAGTGVSCTALCPGPMHTDWEHVADLGDSWMPDIVYVSPEDAVKAGIRGMEQGKRSVIPGRVPQVMAAGGRLTPRTALLPVMRLFSERRKRG